MVDIKSILNQFPRRNLITKSPIQRLTKLEKEINSDVEIYIKRDDLLRPFFGNKKWA